MLESWLQFINPAENTVFRLSAARYYHMVAESERCVVHNLILIPLVWNLKVPRVVKIFIWRIQRYCLPT